MQRPQLRALPVFGRTHTADPAHPQTACHGVALLQGLALASGRLPLRVQALVHQAQPLQLGAARLGRLRGLQPQPQILQVLALGIQQKNLGIQPHAVKLVRHDGLAVQHRAQGAGLLALQLLVPRLLVQRVDAVGQHIQRRRAQLRHPALAGGGQTGEVVRNALVGRRQLCQFGLRRPVALPLRPTPVARQQHRTDDHKGQQMAQQEAD